MKIILYYKIIFGGFCEKKIIINIISIVILLGACNKKIITTNS
jgi:hypothetical protein